MGIMAQPYLYTCSDVAFDIDLRSTRLDSLLDMCSFRNLNETIIDISDHIRRTRLHCWFSDMDPPALDMSGSADL